MLINSQDVTETFFKCLFTEEECKDGTPEHYIDAQGVTVHAGFHPERLEESREQVKQWLSCLPDEFKKSAGGGWSFLNFCNDRDGNLWTGEHRVCDQLITLGIALKECQLLGVEMAKQLPGGMPYVLIVDQPSHDEINVAVDDG